jgi:hypothetical protein
MRGVEYGNGRSKWYYRSRCGNSKKQMMALAIESMSNEVINLGHAMKFARMARDFFRAYRTGSSGADVEQQRVQVISSPSLRFL